jgi:hypothetical protein
MIMVAANRRLRSNGRHLCPGVVETARGDGTRDQPRNATGAPASCRDKAIPDTAYSNDRRGDTATVARQGEEVVESRRRKRCGMYVYATAVRPRWSLFCAPGCEAYKML